MTLFQARQQPLTTPLERAGSVRSALVELSLLCSAASRASTAASVFQTQDAAARKGIRKVAINSFQIDFITHTAATASLAQQGYEVMSREQMNANASYRKISKKTITSPMSRSTRGGEAMVYSPIGVPLLRMMGEGTTIEPQIALVLQGNALCEVKDTTSTADTVGVVAVNVLAALAGINNSSSTKSMSVTADPAGYRSVVGSSLATASDMMVSRLVADR